MRATHQWFSLIEILVWMLIVSTIMISAFQALSSVWIAKVKLIEQTEIEKQAYFASERFFEMIKKGGTIDYEEYWNRYSYDTAYSWWHFDAVSGFWNRGVFYYCKSPNGSSMGTGWCLDTPGNHQMYGQYEQQFIDRNSDRDGDGWDEDGVNGITGDDDDEFLWIWPEAFLWNTYDNKVWELYLISADKNERTYFRWNVGLDPDAISGSCSWWEFMTGTGCLGTIEFLKLSGYDYGRDHDLLSWDSDGTQGDGINDTWLIHDDFNPTGSDIIAGSDSNSYWQPIFPSDIHVSDVEFYVYPNKSLEYSWRDPNQSIFIAPYIQIKMKLQPSSKAKRKIRGTPPVVHIATTIQLSNLDLK